MRLLSDYVRYYHEDRTHLGSGRKRRRRPHSMVQALFFSCATWGVTSSLRSSCLIRTNVESSKERGSSILYICIYAQLVRVFPAGENFAPVGPIQVFSSSCPRQRIARFPVRIRVLAKLQHLLPKRLRAHSQLRILATADAPRSCQPFFSFPPPYLCALIVGSVPQTEHTYRQQRLSDLGSAQYVVDRAGHREATAAAIQLRLLPPPSLLPHETTLYNTNFCVPQHAQSLCALPFS